MADTYMKDAHPSKKQLTYIVAAVRRANFMEIFTKKYSNKMLERLTFKNTIS
jgi:hypothetical protein